MDHEETIPEGASTTDAFQPLGGELGFFGDG